MSYPKRAQCSKGHTYEEGSYRIAADGSRVCRHCMRDHQRRFRTGAAESTQRMRGTGTVTRHGYVSIGKDKKKSQEHRLVAEAVLGKPLPPGAEVHHINGDKQDNRPENLVVCPDKAYHKLLHVRADAMDACGNPNYRKCPFCKQYGDPAAMKHNKSSRYFYHAACSAEYERKRRAA